MDDDWHLNPTDDEMISFVRERILADEPPENEFEVMVRLEAIASGALNQHLVEDHGGRRYRHLVSIDGEKR